MAFSRKRTWGQRARSFANGAYQGYTTARAIKRARTNSRTNSTRQLRRDPFPITGESDARSTYRYKRMPYRKRRQWKSFVQKVSAVQQKALGSNYLVLTRQTTLAATANKQNATAIHTAMGLNGSAFSNDVNTLTGQAATVSTSPVSDQIKFMVTGWMMETQIVNTSSGTAYVDMYYWKCKKKAPRTIEGVATDATALVAGGYADLNAAFPTGGSGLDIRDYGVTPFQSPQWYKTCKVYKKIRVKLASGGVTQVEQRSGKNYVRNWGIDEDYGMDTCTEGIFIIAYGTPSGTNPTCDPINLLLSTNVNYTYKVFNSNANRGGTNAP